MSTASQANNDSHQQPDQTDRTLAVVQAASGLAFSTFAVLHLSGHLLANFGFEYASSAMYISREYYHAPVVEIAVVGGGLVAHVAASAARAIRRIQNQATINSAKTTKSTKKTETKNTANPSNYTETALERTTRQRTWHRLAGWTLAGFMVGHISATRILPILLLPDPSIIDLTYASHSGIKYPGLSHMYFLALGATGIYHVSYGVSAALKSIGIRIPSVSSKTWDGISAGLVAAMSSAALCILGAYGPIYMPMAKQWGVLHAKILGLVGL